MILEKSNGKTHKIGDLVQMQKKDRNYICFPWWYVVFTLVFAVLVCLWPGYHETVLFSILGGIEENAGEVLVVPMGRWLFCIGYFCLITGLEVGKVKCLSTVVIYRCENFEKWWRKQFYRINIIVLLLFGEACLIWIGIEKIQGNQSENIIELVVTFSIHLVLLMTFEICGELLCSKGIIAGILIVLEGLMYVLAEQLSNPWFVGGMLIRSEEYLDSGFRLSVMYAVQILILFSCWFVLGKLLKQKMLNGQKGKQIWE